MKLAWFIAPSMSRFAVEHNLRLMEMNTENIQEEYPTPSIADENSRSIERRIGNIYETLELPNEADDSR